MHEVEQFALGEWFEAPCGALWWIIWLDDGNVPRVLCETMAGEYVCHVSGFKGESVVGGMKRGNCGELPPMPPFGHIPYIAFCDGFISPLTPSFLGGCSE